MKKLLLSLTILSYPAIAELTVSQIEEMVKRIQSKRVSEYEIDFLKIPSPLEGVKKVVEENLTKTVLLDNVADISFTLHAIMNDKAYVNEKWHNRGDKIQGFTLREIFDDHVVLKKDRKTIKVFLVKDKSIKIDVKNPDRGDKDGTK
jgi:hypothetical protein